MSYRRKKRRQISIRVLQMGIVLLGLIIFGRLFQLQILQYEKFGPLSRENSIRQEIITAARGLIFDREGKLLVGNEPIYTITITPASYNKKNTPILADLMNVPVKEVKKRVQEARKYSWYRSSRLFTEVDFKTFSFVQENIWRLPGIGHKIESKRNYPVDSLRASHILGYLHEISEKKYVEAKNYRLGDQIGITGLEAVYEEELRGTFGTKYVRINAMGQNLGSYKNGNIDEAPKKGANLYTSIDTDLQLLAEDLMQGKRGAVVALNPNNGAVLSLVSAPQYEIRRLSGRIDFDYWENINADTTHPLFNRAISSLQPPGSTFKPLMALMGLEMDVITPETEIYNPGYYLRGRRYKDLADPGIYNIGKAIQESSNTFFFWLMDRIVNTKGIDRWNALASTFGLGSKPHIDLPNESTGILPDSTYLNNILGKGNWGLGDQMSLGVGQGYLSVSPLQMAVVASGIANGGYRIQPHIVQAIEKSDGTVLLTDPKKEKIKWVDQQELGVVIDGMRRVVTEGSGRYYADLDSIKVAGKTGTAQNPHGEDHGWFICFAPMNNPQIAVAVLIQNGGYGSVSAAPIASLLVEQYLTGKIDRPWVYHIAKTFYNDKKTENDNNDNSEETEEVENDE